MEPDEHEPVGALFLTVPRAAVELGVSDSQVYKLIQAGRIATVKRFGRLYVPAQSIAHFLRPNPPEQPDIPERAQAYDSDDWDTQVPTPAERGLPFALVVWPKQNIQGHSPRWTYHASPEAAKAHVPQHDRWSIVDVTRTDHDFDPEHGNSMDAWVRRMRCETEPESRTRRAERADYRQKGEADAR